MITATIINEVPNTDIHFIQGSLQNIAARVLPPEICENDCLVFVSKPDQLAMALSKKVPIIIAHKSLPAPANDTTAFFHTSSIQMAMSDILPLFDGKMNRFVQEEKIHPLSSIHPTAQIGQHVLIGPFVVVGAHAIIGDNCTIGANCVIESHAKIGASTLLHPAVFVGAHCLIGDHCEIHPHTTIGSDGFSFGMTKEGHTKKIPQIGIVRIGNHVEIGANCAIDRAALTETVIGDGTKLDNLCHIAHNVQIGQNGLFAAGFMTAGSTKIGNHFMCGGNVVAADHLEITDKVIIAGRSTITNDIKESGQYGGYPLENFRDHLRTVASLPSLPKLRKQVSKVLKALNLNDE